jgi:hypothetical protein
MARLFAIIILITAAAVSAQQSLGDAARAARAQKQRTATNKPAITNDSLRLMGGPMTEATASSSLPTADTSKDAAKSADKAADKSDKDEAAAKEDQKKQLADDLAKTKAELDQLTRELDVMQRENRLRAATYYADAGNRLRNEQQYAAADRQYQQDIQNKQSAINAAKAKLDGLREQARRLGVPAS